MHIKFDPGMLIIGICATSILAYVLNDTYIKILTTELFMIENDYNGHQGEWLNWSQIMTKHINRILYSS